MSLKISNLATAKQVALLKKLEYTGNYDLTVDDGEQLITKLIRQIQDKNMRPRKRSVAHNVKSIPSYRSVHIWIAYWYGKAFLCENQDCPLTTSTYHWSNISGKYLRNREDWRMLCVSCHKYFDVGNRCRKGHLLDENNLYVNPNKGYRSCRICLRNNYLKRRRNNI